MKKFETPWSIGSMFICDKCGASFDEPKMAEKLKSELRSHLKETDDNKKIRVMVTGCLSVCNKGEQTIMYQPRLGKTEILTIDNNFKANLVELKRFIAEKIEK